MPSDGMKARLMPAAAISDAGSTSTRKLPSGRTSESTAMPAASSSRPTTIGVFGPKRFDDPRRHHDHQQHDRDGHRQQRGAALEGAVAEHLLQVEVQEEPHRDPRGAEQELRDVGRRQVRGAEDAEPHQRLTTRGLERDEHAEQRERRRASVSSVAAEPQPSSGARTTPKTVSARPAVAVIAPTRSIEPRRAGAAGIRPGVTASTTSAIGMLT